MAPFIIEQVASITDLGVEADYFTIEQKGIKGYLRSRKSLISKIADYKPDIIHAHYGLAGLLANLQRKVPVITTYHGSDINHNRVFLFSKIAICLSKFNIFVSKKNIKKAGVERNFALIPCGVDTAIFHPQDKTECREQLGLKSDIKYVLFSSSFDNEVKNPKLAQRLMNKLQGVELLELKGYSREEVSMLMNAVDCCLMTSHTEGSPQFIKEAMACGCPILTVDVGDVKEVIGDTPKAFVCENYNDTTLIEMLRIILDTDERTNGRERIETLKLDLRQTAQRLKDIYTNIAIR